MDKQKYKPVKHTREKTARLLAADPDLKKAYEALNDEFAQAEIAKRMGIKPSSLARIESSLGDRKHSPSLSTLRKYASACGKRLVIKLA